MQIFNDDDDLYFNAISRSVLEASDTRIILKQAFDWKLVSLTRVQFYHNCLFAKMTIISIGSVKKSDDKELILAPDDVVISDDGKDPGEGFYVPPPNHAVEIHGARRVHRFRCLFLSLVAISAVILTIIILSGVFLFGRVDIRRGPSQWCSVQFRDPQKIDDGGLMPDSDMQMMNDVAEYTLNESISIDIENNIETIDIPELYNRRSVTVLHDFYHELTAYHHWDSNVCYIRNLDKSAVFQPKTLQEFIDKVADGSIIPDFNVVRETYYVGDRIENVVQLGPYINELCYGNEMYRLERMDSAPTTVATDIEIPQYGLERCDILSFIGLVECLRIEGV